MDRGPKPRLKKIILIKANRDIKVKSKELKNKDTMQPEISRCTISEQKPQLQKQRNDCNHEAKAKPLLSSSSRRNLKEELTNRIGLEAIEANKRRKIGGEGGEEKVQDRKKKDDEHNEEAAFDHEPQLPGMTGATQAIKERLQAESRGQTVVALVLNQGRQEDDESHAVRMYPRSKSKGRSSNRGKLIEALSDQIKFNQVVAKTRKADKQLEARAEAMQVNSAKSRKKGDATVQGREFEQRHVHVSSKCEFSVTSRTVATTSGTTSSVDATHNPTTNERLMSLSRHYPSIGSYEANRKGPSIGDGD